MSMKKKGEESMAPMTLSAAMGHSKGMKKAKGEEHAQSLFHNIKSNKGGKKTKGHELSIHGAHDSATRVHIPSAKKMASKKRTGFHMPKDKG